MISSPLIAVIVPTIESRTNSLLRALRSVVLQQLKPNFVVVVFQGSCDNSLSTHTAAIEILNNSSIDLLWKHSDKFLTPASARNLGISAIQDSVDFISFLDDDDLWLPHHLMNALRVLSETSSTVYCCSSLGYFCILGKTFLYPAPLRCPEIKNLLIRSPFKPKPTPYYSRPAVNAFELGCLPSQVVNVSKISAHLNLSTYFDDSLGWHEDLYLVKALLSKPINIAFAPFAFSVIFQAPLPSRLSNSTSLWAGKPFILLFVQLRRTIYYLGRSLTFSLSPALSALSSVATNFLRLITECFMI